MSAAGDWATQAAPGLPRTVVTPEAVVLDLHTASAGSRILAKALDLIVAETAASAIGLAFSPLGSTVAGVVALVLGALALFGYPAILETLWRGKTVGKAAAGLRVVRADGGPIGARQAVVRAVLLPLDLIVGVLSMLLSPRDRRLGDVLAGTIVRHESRRRDVPAVWFAPPPGLDGYAAALDPSGLTPTDVLVVRSLLLRYGDLAAGSRWPVAAAVATPIAARLGHDVPPGLAPELYLQCLLAARQAWDTGTVIAPPSPPMWGPPTGRSIGGPPPGGWGPPAVG